MSILYSDVRFEVFTVVLLKIQGIAMPSSSGSSSSRRLLVHDVQALESFKTSVDI